MKKYLIIMIFGLFTINSNSQCKLEKSIDKFNNSITFDTKKENVGKNFSNLKMKVTKTIKEGKSFYVLIFDNLPTGCNSSKSYVQFLFENKESIKLNYSTSVSMIKCGVNYMIISITEEEIGVLLKNKITDIRVKNDSDTDYSVDEKHIISIHNLMNCILQAKE